MTVQHRSIACSQILNLRKGFSLVEVLVVISIMLLLIGIAMPTLSLVRAVGYNVTCCNNLHQLVIANETYAAANNGSCAPGSLDAYSGNLHKWYGTRKDANSPYDLKRGPISRYIDMQKIACPVSPTFKPLPPSDVQYDQGSGGYGYNMLYIGSRIWKGDYDAASCLATAKVVEVKHPDRTLMFADTAMARKGFYVEYSFAEPRYFVIHGQHDKTWDPNPSLHFRHRKRVNIGWADGHTSRKKIGDCDIVNTYGIKPFDMDVGWFEPLDNTFFDLE